MAISYSKCFQKIGKKKNDLWIRFHMIVWENEELVVRSYFRIFVLNQFQEKRTKSIFCVGSI